MNKENISTIFLLPAIQIKNSVKKEFYDNGFINTYITTNKIKYPYEVIFLLFNPSEFDYQYAGFESRLISNENYIECNDLGNNYVLYTFKIPQIFIKEYYLFLDGRYSEFSKEYKELFPNKSHVYDNDKKPLKDKKGGYLLEDSPYFKVFNKDEGFKEKLAQKLGYEDTSILDDVELYDKQDEVKEKFNIEFDI